MFNQLPCVSNGFLYVRVKKTLPDKKHVDVAGPAGLSFQNESANYYVGMLFKLEYTFLWIQADFHDVKE